MTLREGLTVYSVDGDVATFGVLGLRMTASLDALVCDQPIEAGAIVSVWMPNERRASSPGFWSLFGRIHPPDREDTRLVRCYWNLCAAGAPQLVRTLGKGLDDAGVAYRLKLLSAPHEYRERADTAVLYLERDDWEASAEAIVRAHEAVSGLVEDASPLFTRRVAPGLATADDPGDLISFGQHRCDLVAEGLVRAWEAGHVRTRERLDSIDQAFVEVGLDPARPHLSPASSDLSDPPFAPKRPRRRTTMPPVKVALALCRRIADDAVWNGDRCGWVAPMVLRHPEGGYEQGWGTLGADLYDGCAGVALVLAEVGAAGNAPCLL